MMRNKRVPSESCCRIPHHQLKCAFVSDRDDFHSKPGLKLGDILCSANESEPNIQNKKEVYQLVAVALLNSMKKQQIPQKKL